MPCITHETPAERAEAERRHREAITGPLHREIDALKHRLAERDAMLCGVFTLLDNGFESHGITFFLAAVLDKVNWREAGVTAKATLEWWEDHKRQDEERQAREAAELEAARNKVLKKLTAEERKILGVDG